MPRLITDPAPGPVPGLLRSKTALVTSFALAVTECSPDGWASADTVLNKKANRMRLDLTSASSCRLAFHLLAGAVPDHRRHQRLHRLALTSAPFPPDLDLSRATRDVPVGTDAVSVLRTRVGDASSRHHALLAVISSPRLSLPVRLRARDVLRLGPGLFLCARPSRPQPVLRLQTPRTH